MTCPFQTVDSVTAGTLSAILLPMQTRVMAIDYGEARIGCALSDALGLTAGELFAFDAREAGTMSSLLARIEKAQVKTVVVGLPRVATGALGEQAEKTVAFACRLRRSLSTDSSSRAGIVLLDERFSSVAAKEIASGKKRSQRRKKDTIDKISAALILETFLLRKQSVWALCALLMNSLSPLLY